MKEKIEQLIQRRKSIAEGGGPAAIEKQKAAGKLTSRQRLELLLDKATFQEIGQHSKHHSTDLGLDKKEIPADAVVCGTGKINGRTVAVFSQDFTVIGGSLGKMHATKICRVMDLALENGWPFIGINDSGGARIQEGVNSLAGYGDIFYRNTLASGVIPQISVIVGPCAGGAVYSPALTDFVFMVEKISRMFITGPEVIKTVLGEEIGQLELGGGNIHNELSGNAHFLAGSEEECFANVRKLLSYLPSSSAEKPPLSDYEKPAAVDLTTIVPVEPKKPYDVRQVIQAIVDKDSFLEVQKYFATNIVVGFARLGGRSVGIVANQPKILAGVLDVDSSDKASRFVRFCDAFNIPLITLVDVPGYLPGVDQEHSGVIRHGAKLLYAYSEATVPKLTVILRKAYGGGYIAMCSKHLGADMVFAWPTAEIAVMGPQGAVNIIYKNELARSREPEKLRKQLTDEYVEKFASPYVAASYGYVDEIITPAETRQQLLTSLENLSQKKVWRKIFKKHGNMPL